MRSITAVHGDITQQRVDAVVNAANRSMRGGGGVDGAIHRAGGPAVLADCIARFPRGLETGDAGWTTAGDLPASWIIHTVGPNYAAGERDPALLASCYRRALEVADELGAHSVTFPLVSAGVYGWPLRDAVRIAVRTLLATRSRVDDVRITAFDDDAHCVVQAELVQQMLIGALRGVRVLHERGFQRVRVLPGMSASGVHWRLAIAEAAMLEQYLHPGRARDAVPVLRYSTAAGMLFAGTEVSATTPPPVFADLILAALPGIRPAADPEYAAWFARLVDLVVEQGALPVAYADDYVPVPGWEIGWGSGLRHPEPPERTE